MDPQLPPIRPVPDRRHTPAPRRRSIRAEYQVPVVVKWVAQDRTAKEETTETKVVNAHGCLLSLKAPVTEGQTVELVNRSTKNARRSRVIFCGRVGADGRTEVAVELDHPDPRFWGERYVDFLLWMALQPG